MNSDFLPIVPMTPTYIYETLKKALSHLLYVHFMYKIVNTHCQGIKTNKKKSLVFLA